MKRIKCIKDDGWAAGILKKGKVYEVLGENGVSYVVTGEHGLVIHPDKSRFEAVQESDYEFFAAVPKGHCACNTPREKCIYHKDDGPSTKRSWPDAKDVTWRDFRI